MVEGHRLLALGEQLLVEDVEHLQKRHVGRDAVQMVIAKFPRILRPGLPPDTQMKGAFLWCGADHEWQGSGIGGQGSGVSPASCLLSPVLLVTAGGQFHFLEGERLFVERLVGMVALVFPGGHVSELVIVTPGFSVGSLMLLSEVSAGRLFALQRVLCQQFAELQEIGNAAGMFEALIELLAATGDVDGGPEFLAQALNLIDRRFQPGGVSG